MSETLQKFFDRHEKVVMQFSAGKDSAACLWLLEPWWDKVLFLWSNPGNPYPETLEYMEWISSQVPNFQCILGNQPDDVRTNGYPVDCVPMECTEIGMTISNEKQLKLRPFWECCANNMWTPAMDYITRSDYTGVIRGQKHSDTLQSPIRSGQIIDGLEYFYPIAEWTDEAVLQWLGDRIPDSYKRGLKSSLDCMDCTAYASHNPGRIPDLKNISHADWVRVTFIHRTLLQKMQQHIIDIGNCHGE